MFKKLFVLTLILSVVYSCKEDEVKEAVLGTWIGTSVNTTECSNTDLNIGKDVSCSDIDCYRLVLLDDGTYTYQQGLPTARGSWSTGTGSITLCVEIDGEQVCDVYEIQGNTATSLVLSTVNQDSKCRTTVIFSKSDLALQE